MLFLEFIEVVSITKIHLILFPHLWSNRNTCWHRVSLSLPSPPYPPLVLPLIGSPGSWTGAEFSLLLITFDYSHIVYHHVAWLLTHADGYVSHSLLLWQVGQVSAVKFPSCVCHHCLLHSSYASTSWILHCHRISISICSWNVIAVDARDAYLTSKLPLPPPPTHCAIWHRAYSQVHRSPRN